MFTICPFPLSTRRKCGHTEEENGLRFFLLADADPTTEGVDASVAWALSECGAEGTEGVEGK